MEELHSYSPDCGGSPAAALCWETRDEEAEEEEGGVVVRGAPSICHVKLWTNSDAFLGHVRVHAANRRAAEALEVQPRWMWTD